MFGVLRHALKASRSHIPEGLTGSRHELTAAGRSTVFGVVGDALQASRCYIHEAYRAKGCLKALRRP